MTEVGRAKAPTPLPADQSAGGKVISTTISGFQAAWATGRADTTDVRWRVVKASVMIVSLVVSAALLSMEIGSRSHPWLGWLTLLPLLAAIRLVPPARALGCGALWGSALFLFLASAVDPLIPATVGSFALLSMIPAAYAFLAARVIRRFGFNPLILGFGWAGVELALIPLGLRGGLLAGIYGHEAGGYMHVVAGVFGPVCMASFIVAANGILLAALRHACVRGWSSRRRYVSSSIKIQRRFFPLEVPHYPFFCANPAQPRAPPA